MSSNVLTLDPQALALADHREDPERPPGVVETLAGPGAIAPAVARADEQAVALGAGREVGVLMAAGELEGGDLPRSVLADADRPAEKMAHVQLAGGKVGGCPDANPDHVREDKSKGGSMSRTGWIGAVLVAALPGLAAADIESDLRALGLVELV